jgi:hypothetical protein
VAECNPLIGLGTLDDRRILDSLLRRDRLPRPHGAHLRSCSIANREHKVHHRRTRLGELVPVFAARALVSHSHVIEQLKGDRMNCSLRMAARAISFELAAAPVIHQSLSHDAPGRIASAQEQHVV